MTPIVIQDVEGNVLLSGKTEVSVNGDIEISSSNGSTRTRVGPGIVRIVLPITGELEDWTPPEDGQLAFEVASYDEDQQAEEEKNRVGGTIRPQDVPAPTATETVFVDAGSNEVPAVEPVEPPADEEVDTLNL